MLKVEMDLQIRFWNQDLSDPAYVCFIERQTPD